VFCVCSAMDRGGVGGAHPRPSPRPSAETSSTINLLSVIAVLVAVS